MLTPELKNKIEGLVAQNDVVLFMKGTRGAPQCGFSAQVVQILDRFLDEYATVNVLADPDVREGIKEFSDWPTIPQLYIKGEFQGGCDIVKGMLANGELKQKLGVDPKQVPVPSVTVTLAAQKALAEAKADAGDGQWLHLEIDGGFRTNMGFGERDPDDVLVEANGMQLLVDYATAKRANGLTIDFVTGPNGGGFKIDNPNAPAPVQPIAARELKAKLDEAKAAGRPLALIDVRGPDEWQRAHIDGARLLDDAVQKELLGLDKSTPLYFVCHTGVRSHRAAEHFRSLGFKRVFNVTGGIDAWSVEVDHNVPRY